MCWRVQGGALWGGHDRGARKAGLLVVRHVVSRVRARSGLARASFWKQETPVSVTRLPCPQGGVNTPVVRVSRVALNMANLTSCPWNVEW